jgi:hypothetical protein
MPIDLAATTTGDSLAAYLEEAYPGKFGAPADRAVPTALVTVNQFKLAERFPTLGDVADLFRKTVPARAAVGPPADSPNWLTQTQQMNFALFLGDPTNPAVVAAVASMPEDLKKKILDARTLVV